MADYKRQVIIYDLIIDGNVVFTGTADEIAEKLGISTATVYTRHRKGKHILQEKRRELRTHSYIRARQSGRAIFPSA